MAMHAELVAAFEALPGVTLRLAEPVAHHSALRIGGEVEAWVLALDDDGVKAVVAALRAAGVKLRPHQPLGDHYAREEGLSGAMLRLGPAFGELQLEGDALVVGAAVPMAQLGVVAQREGLIDWAPARAWPGTLGGWLQCADPAALGGLVRSVRALVGRSIKDRPPEAAASFGAKAVILGAVLEARHGRALPCAPLAPGSLFAVDDDMRRAMRHSRLPGLRLRHIRLADEEAGVVVNLGAGSSRDLDLVIRLVKERLLRDHGLEVEPRLQPLGLPPKNTPAHRVDPP